MTEDASPQPQPGPQVSKDLRGGVDYTARRVQLHMSDFHLKYLLQRQRERCKGPTFEQAAIFLGIALTGLMTLLTTTFKKAGFSAATWQAFTFLLVVISALIFAGLFVRWLYHLFRYPPKTVEEEFAEIKQEMIAETQRETETETESLQAPGP